MNQVIAMQDDWKDMEQVETPTENYFAPGVYMRVIKIPAGTWLIGKTHKTEHLNVALSGEAKVFIAGQEYHVKAPFIIKSFPGEKKLFDVKTELLWATIHATAVEDIEEIERATVMSEQEEKALIYNLNNEVTQCLGAQ
jgi:hypothetical protein